MHILERPRQPVWTDDKHLERILNRELILKILESRDYT